MMKERLTGSGLKDQPDVEFTREQVTLDFGFNTVWYKEPGLPNIGGTPCHRM